MKILILFLCCVPLFFMCCSDSTGPGDTGDGEIVASDNIGAGGGILSSDKIELTVPVGAFDGNTSVALATAPEKAFEDDAVSETYIISGLPQSYSKEISVSLAFTGKLTGSSYIAVGVDTWVSSLGTTTTTYSLLPATLNGEKLTAELPAAGHVTAKAAMTSAEESSSLTVTAVNGYTPHVTAGGHFKIEYGSRWTSLASVRELGKYLEEAYNTVAGLGFSYAARTNWPVSVTVRSLDDAVYGFSTNSLWGDNYGYLEFNSKKMNDLDEMRTTAGHEFFHLVQSLYDPRNFYSKAKFSPLHLWLNEACAVWIEEKFTDQQNYISTARAGNNMTPFNGVVTGAAEDAGKHGYGLSAMIKYLVGEYGESCLTKIYDAVKNGSHPVSAVREGTAEPVTWWPEFLQQYTRGELYNVSIGELTANKSGMFQILYEADTLAIFTGQYPDLSGKLYVIRLENGEIDEDAKLSLSLEGGIGELTVFKYRLNPFGIVSLGSDTEEVSVGGLRSLTEEGWHLIALVSNSRDIYPYTTTSTFTLTVRVKPSDEPDFKHLFLSPELKGEFAFSYQEENQTYSFNPGFSTFTDSPGTMEGTTFTGTWNNQWEDGYIKGTYLITFDATLQNILSIEATCNSILDEGDLGTSYSDLTFTAQNIPFSEIKDGWYYYRLTGNEITGHITSMTLEHGIKDVRWSRLVNYWADEGSSLLIMVW
ncbi:MAG: hypothetical protein JXB48_18695 [Candidatus Latescibacteria bacterium]|nr:hypothetical protein [Candidatus Latescibacterota bacterium]